MEKFDTVIVGAGVIGLAIARAIAESDPAQSVAVLERNNRFGQETSSRNSEVIHAGMYYSTDSLKAGLCVEGNRLLYEFCRKYNIAHEQTGKLIVARTSEEASTLETILGQGRINGVPGLRMLSRREVKRLEPDIEACVAVFSETTGVVDSHQLMATLEHQAAQRGVVFAYGHRVAMIEPCFGGYNVGYRTAQASGLEFCQSGRVINCAGLGCQQLAEAMGIDTVNTGYILHYCKGEYFRLATSKARCIRHLVYPPPFEDMRGLGIHVVRRLDGSVSLGPNAEYVDNIDYAVDPAHAALFYESARRYLPFIELEDLQPDMAGIRPKLQTAGGPPRDFIITDETVRSLPGIISLVGIESPGLTACLSIARMVAGMLNGNNG